jgi:hypothetical protein
MNRLFVKSRNRQMRLKLIFLLLCFSATSASLRAQESEREESASPYAMPNEVKEAIEVSKPVRKRMQYLSDVFESAAIERASNSAKPRNRAYPPALSAELAKGRSKGLSRVTRSVLEAPYLDTFVGGIWLVQIGFQATSLFVNPFPGFSWSDASLAFFSGITLPFQLNKYRNLRKDWVEAAAFHLFRSSRPDHPIFNTVRQSDWYEGVRYARHVDAKCSSALKRIRLSAAIIATSGAISTHEMLSSNPSYQEMCLWLKDALKFW